MDLESFTIAVYCPIEDLLAELAAPPEWPRVRSRGPAPTLADRAVLTRAVVGEVLGYAQDVAIIQVCRRHHPGGCPALGRVSRPGAGPAHHGCPPGGQSVAGHGAAGALPARPAAPRPGPRRRRQRAGAGLPLWPRPPLLPVQRSSRRRR